MSFEWPDHAGELSAWALDHAVEALEKTAEGIGDDEARAEARKALAVVRLVARMPRAAPWWGQVIDPADSSIHVGVMMRNAFESVGDHIDVPTNEGLKTKADHWFTKLYLPRWRTGRQEYHDFLRHLSDPVHWEQEYERGRLSDEQAAAEHARIRDFLRRDT